MGFLSRTFASIRKSLEGEYRPGPYWTSEGVLAADAPWNYWQLANNAGPLGAGSAIVEACVASYAQTVAMCPGDHWRTKLDGGRERVLTSSLTRVIRKPNEYQSISDFLMNSVRSLYLEGNAYALALRNNRDEVVELHPMKSNASTPRIAADGSIFYSLGGNPIVDAVVGRRGLTVPARDVLHLRLQTPVHPLLGETPLVSAALEGGLGAAARTQQIRLFSNGGRPSAIISTDQILDKTQADQVRELWQQQTAKLQAGGVPILTAGMKVSPWATSSVDAQLAETLKMSDEAIAAAFRIPLAILGQGGGTPFASTELLMQQWVASGLGFLLNHIEEAIGNLFELKGQPEEYVEFSTDALLRSSFKDRIEGLARGVQGGIIAPNEARRQEGYSAVKFGDEPRVQQQVVPLSYYDEQRKLEEKKQASADKAAQAAADALANPPAPEPENDNAAESAAKSYRMVRRSMRQDA